MAEIIVLEIISVVSFIYSLLVIPMPFGSMTQVFVVFLWTILASMVFALSYKKSKIYWISGLLLLMPLIFYNTKTSICFILMTSILIVAYIAKSLGQGNHDEYVRQLKQSYKIYAIIAFLGLISEGPSRFFSYSAGFIIIYLFTTVILIRTIRHIESGMDRSKIRKLNAKYLGIISIVSSIVALDEFRNFIFSIIWQVYIFTATIIAKILSYPIAFMAMLLGKFFLVIFPKIAEESSILDGIVQNEEEIKKVGEITRDFPLLNMIIRLVFAALVLYIIYKFIVKTGNRNYTGVEYTEEREYVKSEDKKRKAREKFPKDLREQIRYYYRRYLEKLEKNKIELKKSDTTLEINEKAEKIIREDINGVRSIYIDSRYSDKKIDESMVEKMQKLYKKL